MTKLSFYISALLAILVISCTPKKMEEQFEEVKPAHDFHSYAKPLQVSMDHLDLKLNVDMKKKVISGIATIHLLRVAAADSAWFDTRGLVITKVTIDSAFTPVQFTLGNDKDFLGSSLTVPITPTTQTITITYETTDKSVALQWLAPEQTAGKDFPFLFTQSEANLARSWVPCMDSPGIKFTYSADVTVAKDMLAVMSATNPQQKNQTGLYHFEMNKPIPAYLMALAVGNIEFMATGARTGVYSEPAMVHKAVVEFSELEKMLAAAEMLYGKYAWERYDVIVLPPAFPFGGMENPRLSFLTPTLVVGDKSLTNVVAHELAHSWSGNLVTNATWDDFWLNEGFTVYFERRIVEQLNGKAFADMQTVLGLQDLKETMTDLGVNSYDTKLKLNLTNRDPDDGMTDVAYEKGYLFLRLIEETVGREKFDNFLQDYFKTYAFKSLSTEQFVSYLKYNLLNDKNELKGKINIDEWVYGTGIPSNCPKITSDKFKDVEGKVNDFLKGTPAADLGITAYTTNEWLHFLDALPGKLTIAQIKNLDSSYKLTESGNAEILCKWLKKCIGSNYHETDKDLEYFLTHTGRRKFVKPLYAELAKTPEGLELAKQIYKKARPNYHALVINTIDQLLEKQAVKG